MKKLLVSLLLSLSLSASYIVPAIACDCQEPATATHQTACTCKGHCKCKHHKSKAKKEKKSHKASKKSKKHSKKSKKHSKKK